MKVVVIGGVAAGTKTAAKIKREAPRSEVIIITKGKNISYAGCGLPYYVGDVIHDKGELIVNTPESFSALTGVEVMTGVEAVHIDRASKKVSAVHLDTGKSEDFTYDKLVVAVGADPVKPPVEGVDLEGVYFMRTPEDAIALRSAAEAGQVKRAVVAGGGFIGLEVAENLAKQGVKVSVIDMAEQIMPGFDKDFAEYAENYLADQNIMAFTGMRLEAILGSGHVEKIKTDKRAMKADTVVLSLGIRANTEFLKDTGLELMPNGTVRVNSRMQTNDSDIYAVGDCACVKNRITGAAMWSPMGSSANMEGRVAAMNICGFEAEYKGNLGTAVVKLAGLNAGRTGLSFEAAVAAGFDAVSAVSVMDDKAHYYPSASNFIIKMIADKKSGRFLGLQVMGSGAVDKVTDIAVTALSMGASVYDLENMDLAYAPPFSTAIAPFTTALNVLLNKMSQRLQSITPEEYKNGAAEGRRVLDLGRQPSIEGATYVNLADIKGEIEGIGKNDKLLLVCSRGRRAYMAQVRMRCFGYTDTLVLEGGTAFNTLD